MGAGQPDQPVERRDPGRAADEPWRELAPHREDDGRDGQPECHGEPGVGPSPVSAPAALPNPVTIAPGTSSIASTAEGRACRHARPAEGDEPDRVDHRRDGDRDEGPPRTPRQDGLDADRDEERQGHALRRQPDREQCCEEQRTAPSRVAIVECEKRREARRRRAHEAGLEAPVQVLEAAAEEHQQDGGAERHERPGLPADDDERQRDDETVQRDRRPPDTARTNRSRSSRRASDRRGSAASTSARCGAAATSRDRRANAIR